MKSGILAWLVCVGAVVTGVGPGVAMARPGESMAQAVKIVTVGPEPERATMESALRSLLGSDTALAWTAQTVGEAPAAAANEPPHICIDVSRAGEVRVVVPTRDGAGEVSVRTVPAQASSQPEDLVAARETVAQIVAEAVRALRSEHPAAPVAPDPSPTAPTAVLAATAPPAQAASPARQSALELTLAGGAHTAPFKMAEPSSESNWLGPSVQAQVRWRMGKAAFALRSTWEASKKTIDYLWLRTQFYCVTLAAFRRVQVDQLDLGIGFEAGALYVQQSTTIDDSYPYLSTVSVSPGTLRDTRSLGFLVGPVVEANFKLTQRWFFHLDFAASINGLKMKAGSLGPTTAWVLSPSLRGLMGLGLRI